MKYLRFGSLQNYTKIFK